MIISRSVLLRMANVSDKVVEEMEKSFIFYNFFNRATYDIMWKNIVESVKLQMTI